MNFLKSLPAAALALSFCIVATVQAQPLPLSVYGQLPAMAHPSLSPSGKRVALVATVAGKRHLVAMDVGGKALVAAPVDRIKVRDLAWGGENFVLAIVSSTQNLGIEYGLTYELQNAVVLDIANRTALWPLNNRKILNAAFGIYPPKLQDGRWQLFANTQPLERSDRSGDAWMSRFNLELSRIDLTTGTLQIVRHGVRDGRGWLLDPHGTVLGGERYDDVTRRWTLYAGTDRDNVLAELDDPFGDNEILGQGRTVGTVLYTAHDANGETHIMELALAGGSQPVELPETANARRFVFDPVSELLAGVVEHGEDSTLVMFDEKREARVRGTRKAFPGLRVNFESWSDDFDRLVVLTEGQTDAGTWWLIDIPTGKASALGWRYPEIKHDRVGPYRVVKYQATDGLAMEGILTLPPGTPAQKLPVVVLPHGGPEARDYPQFDWWPQAFASRGYAVWQPNFRGSSGYGIEFRNAGFGQWGRKMQTDISDGLAELVRQGIVDPRRACIVGASYGGYAALAGVTVQQGLYRCAVSVAGVADPEGMQDRELIRRRRDALRYWQAFMGGDDAALDAISPTKLAARADAPVLLIHGKDDTVVPIKQSNTMRRALERAHKPVEMVVLDGEDHWLSRAPTRTAMLEAAVAFVQKHNAATP